MPPTHPFDATLAQLDLRIRRVTTEDIAALSGNNHINITLLVIASNPPVAVDLCLHPAGRRGHVKLTPAPGLRIPVGLVGAGITADGTIEPHALAAAPCKCPRQTGADGRHWNPLGLALRWHPALPAKMSTIVQAYMKNIADEFEQYCEDGVVAFLEALKAREHQET